jgi:hypothetical protein
MNTAPVNERAAEAWERLVRGVDGRASVTNNAN